ncbi:MAG: superoxide dismutase family protein [Cytophagales bacterium]|nr:superoxide dismutase family protein [Cytophagales bacterium]
MKSVWPFAFLVLFLMGCPDPADRPVEREIAGGELNALEALGDDQYITTSVNKGQVSAATEGNVVTLTIELDGFTANTSHAIHLHNGSCEDPGAHWNQNSSKSFCAEESLGVAWRKSYAGDIGNITTDSQGRGYLRLSTDLWTLNTGLDSDILNKVLVIHERGEDFGPECFILTAHDHDGNSKIACGRIELRD